jgi:hypothetical protein
MAATARSAVSPTQSDANATGFPSSLESSGATGARLISGTGFPLGRPRCESRIVFAPWSIALRIVGTAALRRVSSVTFPDLSIGTLKSTRMSVLFPERSSWSTVRIFMVGISFFGGRMVSLRGK